MFRFVNSIHLSLVQLNVLMQDKDGNTGLILACSNGQKAVAELLIQKGANVMCCNKVRKLFGTKQVYGFHSCNYTLNFMSIAL